MLGRTYEYRDQTVSELRRRQQDWIISLQHPPPNHGHQGPPRRLRMRSDDIQEHCAAATPRRVLLQRMSADIRRANGGMGGH